MGDIEEVQEQMKADTEALKDNDGSHVKHKENDGKQCSRSFRRQHYRLGGSYPSLCQKPSEPTCPKHGGTRRRGVRQYGGPHMGYNRNAYPYGLPPNYTPPTMHMPNENINHVVPVTFEGQ